MRSRTRIKIWDGETEEGCVCVSTLAIVVFEKENSCTTGISWHRTCDSDRRASSEEYGGKMARRESMARVDKCDHNGPSHDGETSSCAAKFLFSCGNLDDHVVSFWPKWAEMAATRPRRQVFCSSMMMLLLSAALLSS
jgi:hypothetical protein